jgi:hypothetical protein
VLLAGLAAGMLVASAAVSGQDLRLADTAPQTYTVQKGDTLWGISGKFLKDPWRWPEVWRMNRDEIRNPHWIYPGDVVRLDMVGGQPRLSLASGTGGPRPTVRVAPAVRSSPIDPEAIPSIPPGDIEPYLSKPLVTGPEGLRSSGEIVAGRDRDRVIRGDGDRVYAVGIAQNAGDLWYIYRPVGTIRSLDRRQALGFEYRFLGTARVERFADVATLLIENAKEEILVGDRLIPVPPQTLVNYVPHAPAVEVDGRIIASARDQVEMGRGSIVTIDRGARDGIDVGTVLSIYRGVAPIPDPRPNNDAPVLVRHFDQTTFWRPERFLEVPQERTGLMFVFRVFEQVSFAILLNTTDPVQIGDFVRKP